MTLNATAYWMRRWTIGSRCYRRTSRSPSSTLLSDRPYEPWTSEEVSYDLICFWPYMSRSGECLKGVSIFLPVDCGLSADSIYWLVDCGLSADKNDDERPLHSSLA